MLLDDLTKLSVACYLLSVVWVHGRTHQHVVDYGEKENVWYCFPVMLLLAFLWPVTLMIFRDTLKSHRDLP
jgi:hypothetical protein